ncbi:unnamed protein product [Arctia plantaginis]|uniref:Uncharacterized protein n=1 Tax=Arctia plantaginis TaxID=874455 RepID=A0A8S0ZSD1_ARCPL|nr:unnamed protein product [Arctia plantaginis]
MTLFSLICLVFIETVTVYSTQKLKLPDFSKGDTIKYDQLSKFILEDPSSSEEYLSNDPIVNYLRNENHEPGKPSDRSEGYIFNEKLCKLIKKRILCGYDRNKGEISEEKSVDIGNNCIIRNDRIECGYLSKPFNSSLHLRFRSVTFTESSITTITNKTGSTEKQDHINISENFNTNTELPVQLPVSNTSESTINVLNTPERSFKETSPVTQPLKIAPDTILLNKSSPAILSSSVPPIKTAKESDPTTSLSSPINFIKNITNKIELPIHSGVLNNEAYTENRNKTESVRQGLIRKLMNNIENKKAIRREEPHIESIPPSKNCKCPNQASILKDSSTTFFLRARRNSKSLRKGNNKTNIKTACVENKDRIVCLDYKLE